MPELTTTAATYLSRYVQPLAAQFGLDEPPPFPAPPGTPSPYDVFKAAVLAVAGGAQFVINIPNPFPDLGGSGGGAAPVPAPLPGLTPIDPTEVLKAIAEAVGAAEKILNAENLAIGGATAEVNVVVSIGGIAGANATLKINLGPTPRG